MEFEDRTIVAWSDTPWLPFCCVLAMVVVFAQAGCETESTPAAGATSLQSETNEPDARTGDADATTNDGETRQIAGSGQAATGGTESGGEFESALPDPDSMYKNWPTPDLVLFLTGQQHGYIEPCGCTGLANQKGGMARRHTLARQLKERGWPTVAVDVGNQVRRFGRQAELKFQITVEGLKTIGYDAVAYGADDLRLSIGEVMAVTADPDGGETPFLCANASLFDPSLTPTHKVVERAGKKVGITAVIGDEWSEKIKSDEVIRTPAGPALRKVLAALKNAGCDVYVLLAHATLEESQQMGRDFPEFDIIVSAGGQGDPTYQPEQIGTEGPLLVRVGVKGMHVGLIGLFEAQEPRFRYQRIPLTGDEFSDSPEMLQLLASYQGILEDQGLDGLQVRPIAHPSGRQFVGSEACADCHESAFEIWRESPHFLATEHLVHPGERSEIYRHFDPECLSCHVTGWNPQRFYPYQTGYLGLTETPQMHGSGCENCHGPGSQHVAAENGEIDASEELLSKFREGMRLPLAKAELHCMQCHDLDNSPDFHEEGEFLRYWEQIKH